MNDINISIEFVFGTFLSIISFLILYVLFGFRDQITKLFEHLEDHSHRITVIETKCDDLQT